MREPRGMTSRRQRARDSRTSPSSPSEPTAAAPDHLTPTEMSLLERLVARGAFVAVPALNSQKPRQVVAAALSEHGSRVLLYLSAKPIDLGQRAQSPTSPAPSGRRKG
jgi:hypothetical protein